MNRAIISEFCAMRDLASLPNPAQLRAWARVEAAFSDMLMRDPMRILFTADKISVNGKLLADRTVAETEPTVVPFKEVPIGALFTHEGHQYRKNSPSTGQLVNLNPVLSAQRTFWHLAPVTVLRPKKVDADGWIEWSGGACPVPRHAEGQVKLRNGNVIKFGGSAPCVPWGFTWSHNGDLTKSAEIVAYKVITPAPEPQLTDWFPGTQAPWESGVYELWNGQGARLFARFDADRSVDFGRTRGVWLKPYPDRLHAELTATAIAMNAHPCTRHAKVYQWRGLAHPPKAAA